MEEHIVDKKKVFVCGGGHQGLSMAAHLALNGISVTMWNRTPGNIQEVIDTNAIFCNGIVNGVAYIEQASSNVEDVVSDFVMVTTPSSAHKDVAKRLAPYVHKDMVIILNPGRTFGAIEFATTLLECGVKELPHIAETQTIVYTCRRSAKNRTTIFALKEDVAIAALKDSSIEYIMERMPDCIRYHFNPVNSIAYTSLENVGMVLHCAPVLMNVGWIETPKVDFKYYYDGISENIAALLEKIDNERILVSKKLGYIIESTANWMKRVYGVEGKDLFECIRNNETYKEIDAPPTIYCRYILEDVPNGLVPIEYVASQLGLETPNITMIINLACSLLNTDFRENGRRFTLEQLSMYFSVNNNPTNGGKSLKQRVCG